MPVAILFLLLTIAGIIIFIPPFHWFIIFSLTSLVSLTGFLALRRFIKSTKYSLIASLTLFILLSLLTLKLFDPVNILLAISFIIGIIILIK